MQCTPNFHVGVLSVCTVRRGDIYAGCHRKRWGLDRDCLLPLEALNVDFHYAVGGFYLQKEPASIV